MPDSQSKLQIAERENVAILINWDSKKPSRNDFII
jgi:hypothetical protein